MEFTLEISRMAGVVSVDAEPGVLGVIQGGPPELLSWLETQLGLGGERRSDIYRVARYSHWIDAAAPAEVAKSIAADPWEAAATLLRRRDALRMGGWHGGDIDVDLPAVRAIVAVEALARGSAQDEVACPRADGNLTCSRTGVLAKQLAGESERIDEVTRALDAGQVLPPHRVHLLERLEDWPWRWRQLLGRFLTVYDGQPGHRTRSEQSQIAGTATDASPASALKQLQNAVSNGKVADVELDDSLAWIEAPSAMSAIELVGAVLSDEMQASRTVVACADPNVRQRLEQRLRALKLPAAGVQTRTHVAPALVLPLAIEMCRRTVAPGVLLDFLQLPVGPLPRGPARRLARALAEQPGLGSERWQEVWREVCAEDADPDGSARSTLEQWLLPEMATPPGDGGALLEGDQPSDEQETADRDELSIGAVLQCCDRVATWAREEARRAAAKRPDRPPALHAALLAAAEQAETVSELLQEELQHQSGRPTIARRRLRQWISASCGAGLEVQPFEREAGAVRVVASPAEIRRAYDRLIWLGGWQAAEPVFEWSACEVDALREAGIELDVPTNGTAARTGRERAGFLSARRSCVLVRMPACEEWAQSALWIHLETCLAGADHARRASRLRDLVEGRERHSAVDIVACATGREPPQPARSSWRLRTGPLRIRTRSATEMMERLACPLRWVLKRTAHIAPAGNVRLPGEFQLAGTFCHQVLRLALEDGVHRSPSDVRRRVLDVFDARVRTDAALLAGSAAAPARGRLREQLSSAADRLARLFEAGRYTRAEFEVPFVVPLDADPVDDEDGGVELSGMIDCLATKADGHELVIDFKYGGDTRRRDEIRQGRAVQLATYAYSRYRATGRYPAVAYLVLSTGQVYAPRESRPSGMEMSDCESGPPIESVWLAFADALQGASSWTGGNAPVPCRPLQLADQWPKGTELVLDLPSGSRDSDRTESYCRYCDYGCLCGRISLE